MHAPPTQGVKGVKPRFKSAKQELPKLSKAYLELRNRQMAAKAFVAETQAARARGELISRKLVEFQASYLLVAMRQRILALPQAYAGRLVGLTDPHEVSQILRAAMIELLDELKDLPSRATDANWLERVAEEQAAGGAEPVAKAGKRGPPGRAASRG